MEDSSATVSENLIAFGPSNFIRKVAIPLATEVEGLAKKYPPALQDVAWKPQLQDKPRADVSLIAGLVGVVAFVASWAAKKALDELYENDLRPALRRAMRGFIRSDASDKKYAASLLINKSPERISILIAAVGRTLEEIERSEKQIASVAAVGLQRAQQLAKPGQVHLYIIEEGAVNAHPWVYENVAQAMQHISSMAPAKMPKLLRNRS